MPTDAQIAQNLDFILADSTSKGMSEAATSRRITDMWKAQGVTLDRVAKATRYSAADIENVLGRVADQGQAIDVSALGGAAPARSAPSRTTSAAPSRTASAAPSFNAQTGNLDTELQRFLASATSAGMSEAAQTTAITDSLFAANISLQTLADETRYNEGDIQNILGRVADQGYPVNVPGDFGLTPTTGLAGAETALNAGLVQARNDVTGSAAIAQDRIQTTTGQAAAELNPFKQTGLAANNRLAALNGLLGPEAQAQAFEEFRSSPGQDFLREQANNNVIGNATAIGGVGGGDVRRELLRQGAGLAAQDFGAQVGRLESTRAGGQQAATGTAQLLGNSGMAEAEVLQNQGRQLADLGISTATNTASGRLSTSQLLGNQAFQSGIQQAGFNQQNRLAGASAIGSGGSNIAAQIAEAARQSGNVNLSQAQIASALAQLGINTIPDLYSDRSTGLAAGQLAGANKDAELATTIGKAIIGGV